MRYRPVMRSQCVTRCAVRLTHIKIVTELSGLFSSIVFGNSLVFVFTDFNVFCFEILSFLNFRFFIWGGTAKFWGGKCPPLVTPLMGWATGNLQNTQSEGHLPHDQFLRCSLGMLPSLNQFFWFDFRCGCGAEL